MSPYLSTVIAIAQAIPRAMAANASAYRSELTRRLKLRGWICKHQVRLEPGSRGDNTHRCGTIDLACYPPQPHDVESEEPGPTLVPVQVPTGAPGSRRFTQMRPPPVLIEIERGPISYRTRAKLQSWGQRPCSGKIVIQLFARLPDPIPEADHVLAIGAHRGKTPEIIIARQADLKRLSHAIGINEARYQRRKRANLDRVRKLGGRPGQRYRDQT